MRSKELVVGCYAEEVDGLWQAICLDLNLAAQADTLAEVKLKLERQIVDYIHDAVAGEDQEHAAKLLYRPAPLRYRLKYQLLRLCKGLNLLSSLSLKAKPFSETFSLVPGTH